MGVDLILMTKDGDGLCNLGRLSSFGDGTTTEELCFQMLEVMIAYVKSRIDNVEDARVCATATRERIEEILDDATKIGRQSVVDCLVEEGFKVEPS